MHHNAFALPAGAKGCEDGSARGRFFRATVNPYCFRIAPTVLIAGTLYAPVSAPRFSLAGSFALPIECAVPAAPRSALAPPRWFDWGVPGPPAIYLPDLPSRSIRSMPATYIRSVG